MMVLVTYDVNTETREGKRRLRKVAKVCVDCGQRVQNSVFECLLENYNYRLLQHELLKIADLEKDSIRFYNLGKNYSTKIEHFGVKETYDPQENLII